MVIKNTASTNDLVTGTKYMAGNWMRKIQMFLQKIKKIKLWPVITLTKIV